MMPAWAGVRRARRVRRNSRTSAWLSTPPRYEASSSERSDCQYTDKPALPHRLTRRLTGSLPGPYRSRGRVIEGNLTMQTVTLNNGVEMPILGFGVFQIPPEETQQVVADASRPVTA